VVLGVGDRALIALGGGEEERRLRSALKDTRAQILTFELCPSFGRRSDPDVWS